jgi:ABC-type glycerol-3-phosphate transport system substrate-binding protein
MCTSSGLKILILFVVLTTLSSCSFINSEPTTDVNTPRLQDNIIRISFAAPAGSRDVYTPLIERFNTDNPAIQVIFISLDNVLQHGEPDTGASPAAQIVRAADTAVTRFVGPEDVAAGYVFDLAPFIAADPTFNVEDYYPGTLEILGQGSGTFILPQMRPLFMLAYNKDLWAAQNLAAPTADWTWHDLLAAAEQLTNARDGTIETYGLEAEGLSILVGEIATVAPEMLTTPAAEIQLARPEVITALERAVALVQAGVIYDQAVHGDGGAFDPSALQQLVYDQRLAIWSADLLSPAAAETEPDFDIGIYPPPPLPVPPTPQSTEGYIMSGGTQHPEAAWRWLAFLSQQEAPLVAADTGALSQIPARRSIAEGIGYWDNLDAEAQRAINAALEQPIFTSNDFDWRVLEALWSAVDMTLVGDASAEQSLRTAQSMLDEAVADALLTPSATPFVADFVVATPVPNVAAAGATTITFGTPSFNQRSFEQMARRFNQQNTDIFVNTARIDATTGTLAMAAEQTDCFVWPVLPSADELATTFDLQPLIDADPAFDTSDYMPKTVAFYQQGPALHGLPYAVDLPFLVYHQGMFEQEGIKPPTAAWTLDDFSATAEQLTSGAAPHRQYGFASIREQTREVFIFLNRRDVAVVRTQDETLRLNFTDPAVVEALHAYLDLLQAASPHTQLQGYTPDSWDSEAAQLMNQGQVGMWFGGSLLANIDSQVLATTVAPPPLATGVVTTDELRVVGLHIAATTAHADACWAWLKFVSNDTQGLQGIFPVREALVASDAFAEQMLPGAAAVYDSYRDALARSPNPLSARASAAIDYYWFFRALDNALQGSDLPSELEAAQVLTEEYLTCRQSGDAAGTCARQVDPDYAGFNQPPEADAP